MARDTAEPPAEAKAEPGQRAGEPAAEPTAAESKAEPRPRTAEPGRRAGEAPAIPAAPPRPATDHPEARGRRRWWIWLLAAVVAVLLVYWLTHRHGGASGAKGGAAAGRNGAGAAGQRAVPVSAVAARNRDVGVFLTGLGTVNPLATVAVKSRVDGQLLRLNFQDGQLVHAGDVLAEIDPRPFQVQLLQAQGQKAKDEATLANARLDLQRYEALVREDSIPRQQLDTQVATVRQLEATIQSDQAQIESAQLNLAYCKISAPLSGRVGLRMVDPGNMVHASDANGIVVITQLQPINVVFTLPADQLPSVLGQVHAGRRLPVDALDRDLKKKLASGSLLAVDNQIDPTTGTVRLKALFANEDEALFPNQFVNARLLVDTLRGATVVPTAAVQRSPQSTFVYVVKPDKTVEARNVQVQLTQGEDTVERGAAPGDVVVVDGLDRLRPGMKVEVTRADAANGRRGANAANAGNAGQAPQRTAL